MSQVTDIEASRITRANNLEGTPEAVVPGVDNSRAAINRTRFSRLRAVHSIDNVDERPPSHLKQSTAEKRSGRISYAPGTPLQGVVTLIGPVEPFATGIKMKSSDQEAI